VIGYPPLPADYDTSKGLSCGAHTDYGCLTFLLADDFPGALQGRSYPPKRSAEYMTDRLSGGEGRFVDPGRPCSRCSRGQHRGHYGCFHLARIQVDISPSHPPRKQVPGFNPVLFRATEGYDHHADQKYGSRRRGGAGQAVHIL